MICRLIARLWTLGWRTFDDVLCHVVDDERMTSEYADARTTHHRVPR